VAEGRGEDGHDPAAEGAELAAEQTDPDRLMDGEDPGTQQVEDAEHWLRVYQELYAFKQDLLDKLRTRVTEISITDARDEALADERLLVLELARFERRADFWRRRVQELTA
jgi:hypothetical protein